MIVRRLTCPACGRTWTVLAGDQNVACPGCGSAGEPAETEVTEARFCGCNCGASLDGMRSDALYASEACEKRHKRRTSTDKGPTDGERLLIALRARGATGIHSHEVRKLGISGNPSQRITELEDQGFEIDKRREHKGRRPGTRYTLLAEPQIAGVGAGASGADSGDPGAPDAGDGSPADSLSPAGEPARLFEFPTSARAA